MHIEIKRLKANFVALVNKFNELGEFVVGHCGEIGQQVFGIHIVQEMMCEKLGITPEQVKERIDARAKAMEDQMEAQRASARAHLASVPPDEPPAEDGETPTTETPEQAEGAHEATAEGPDETGKQEPV